MSNVHEAEELQGMNRLALRRIAKGLGLSAEDAATAKSEELVEFIMENQEGGTPAKKASKKKTPTKKAATTKKTTTKKAPPKGGGSKLAAGSRKGKAATKTKDEDPVEAEAGADPATIGLLEVIMEKLEDLGNRVDAIGEVVDTNFKDVTNDVAELRVDLHVTKGLITHIGTWMENDQILTDDAAPGEMAVADAATALEEECEGGNEDE